MSTHAVHSLISTMLFLVVANVEGVVSPKPNKSFWYAVGCSFCFPLLALPEDHDGNTGCQPYLSYTSGQNAPGLDYV